MAQKIERQSVSAHHALAHGIAHGGHSGANVGRAHKLAHQRAAACAVARHFCNIVLLDAANGHKGQVGVAAYPIKIFIAHGGHHIFLGLGGKDGPHADVVCPKGAGLLDFIHSDTRLRSPEYRAPGAKQWQRISWSEAFTRIAKLVKEDRDANFIAKNADGVTVNRWLTTGFLAASASSNEAGYITHKVVRSLGMLAFDNQARV